MPGEGKGEWGYKDEEEKLMMKKQNTKIFVKWVFNLMMKKKNKTKKKKKE